MNTNNYEYDVAFSFAQIDENLACSIYKLLKDRLKCFIYSEEQKKLAGTDGELTFNSVFSSEARIVVIFYSEDWGNTKWTRIEETAIKNRGFEEGYDFTILIPTTKEKKDPPKWLPKTRLWIGIDRWGIESAASVIEARVQEFGGKIKELTLFDKIALEDARIKQKNKIENLLASPAAKELAQAEFEKVKKEFEDIANEITTKLGDWHLMVKTNINNGINLLSYDHCLILEWRRTYLNITISDGYYDEKLQKTDHFYRYSQLLSEAKVFDINESEEYGWSVKDSRKNFLPTKKLADHYLNKFFEIVKKHREYKSR